MEQDKNTGTGTPLQNGAEIDNLEENKGAPTPAVVEKKQEPLKSAPKANKPDVIPGETVKVPKDTLDKLLKRLEILEASADRGRFERATAMQNQDKKLVKTVNLSLFDGRIVVGWKSVKDDVFFDREGKLHEEQTIALFFHGGERDANGNLIPEAEVNMQSFARLTRQHECEVIGEIKENGRLYYKVVDKEGKEITICTDFVNSF